MLESIQQFVTQTDPIWQWLALMLIGAIPYFESYSAAALGVIAGISLPIAIGAGVIGNIASMLLFVEFGHRLNGKRNAKSTPVLPSAKREKVYKMFDQYGIAGVSLLGQVILPSQLTSLTMVGFGASKQKVIWWQIVAITVWGAAFGVLAFYSVDTIQMMLETLWSFDS